MEVRVLFTFDLGLLAWLALAYQAPLTLVLTAGLIDRLISRRMGRE